MQSYTHVRAGSATSGYGSRLGISAWLTRLETGYGSSEVFTRYRLGGIWVSLFEAWRHDGMEDGWMERVSDGTFIFNLFFSFLLYDELNDYNTHTHKHTDTNIRTQTWINMDKHGQTWINMDKHG